MRKTGKTRPKGPTLAETADRHRLYELSVQCAEAEIDFVDDTFRKLRGRKPRRLREDFCGTAGVCCEWIKRRRTNEAVGVDIDPEVLDWGHTHNLSGLTPAQLERLTLLREDVLRVRTGPMDAILAMNFSYWLLKERDQLKRYLRRAREALAEDGMLFLDAYGGYDSFREIEEERELDGFTYVWEQAKYEPISGNLICHIHFDFPDGSRMERAFSYDWRLWTLPEIRDLLAEVGFSRVRVYWQGWEEDGEPDGNFRPAQEGEADAGWICYITAER